MLVMVTENELSVILAKPKTAATALTKNVATMILILLYV